MESTARVLIGLFLALMMLGVRAEQNRNNSSTEEAQDNVAFPEGTNGGGGRGGSGVYGGGGCGWGWGGPGGSSGGGGGGGGAGYWKCQCKKHSGKGGKHHIATMDFRSENYKMGEFAQCKASGRCKGMKLDCPLHCGGPCLYDCTHTCRPFCKS